MSLNVRDQLLSLVKDDKKREIIASKSNEDFIKELSIQFVEEHVEILNKIPNPSLSNTGDMRGRELFLRSMNEENNFSLIFETSEKALGSLCGSERILPAS